MLVARRPISVYIDLSLRFAAITVPLPQGITPESHEQWTASGEELEYHGVLWLAHQYPCVHVDGISDGKERMRLFWKACEEECARINAEMQKRRSQNPAPQATE